METTKRCAVCDLRDARALTEVSLSGGTRVLLCGSHELMHRRSMPKARTVADLRERFADRRSAADRRGKGEVDELAAGLSAAFGRTRGTERRA